MATLSSILAWEIPQRNLAATIHKVTKSWTQLSTHAKHLNLLYFTNSTVYLEAHDPSFQEVKQVGNGNERLMIDI